MFSLVYRKSNKYGVIDNKTTHFHMLSKESFDLMVDSAVSEGVEIQGVVSKENGYDCTPVAFTDKPNIFNVLPYIVEFRNPLRGASDKVIYQTCFQQLLSVANCKPRVQATELCIKLSVLAYYHIRVKPEDRLAHNIIPLLLSEICMSYGGLRDLLCTEPFPEDVMKKFSFNPIVMEV